MQKWVWLKKQIKEKYGNPVGRTILGKEVDILECCEKVQIMLEKNGYTEENKAWKEMQAEMKGMERLTSDALYKVASSTDTCTACDKNNGDCQTCPLGRRIEEDDERNYYEYKCCHEVCAVSDFLFNLGG